MFNYQKILAHQLLVELQSQLLVSHFVLNSLLEELSNKDSIYKSYKPTIQSRVQLLKINSEFKKPVTSLNLQSKRILLLFLEDALKWLTCTSTMKDTQEIKQHVNQLIQEQTKQQKTLVHVKSILNITLYAAQVNRQKLNEMIDALQRWKI